MGFLGDQRIADRGTVVAHIESMPQVLREETEREHMLRTHLGHSLAQVPCHRIVQVVEQGNLGHSPDSPRWGPRWMVAQVRAGGYEKLGVFEMPIFQKWCVVE
jgi:hypothetical protein